MLENYYITTAIDYVNGKPHIGHAFEKTIADALARWHKLQGKTVYFLTGTDENAQKNAQAAKTQGVSTQELVDRNSQAFIELCKKLNIDYDRFIRTTEPAHTAKAQELFQKAFDKGDIYKGAYEGHYCEGCEAFKTEKELINGNCPDHDAPPKFISEETYFFKLSAYKDKIEEFVESYIYPQSRKNEILARLKEDELKDISVTRINLDWGIDAPIDNKHKIYVWFDALINYISGAEDNWPADLHIIGKDINWFHSVIWPAILLATDHALPKKLLVHGFLNLKGEKMSKSKGNVLDPIDLIEKYGADSVRYSLLRGTILDDADYSEDLLIQRNNGELADKLGNLVSRVSALAEKHGLVQTTSSLSITETYKAVEKHLEHYELDRALNEIFAFIDRCNEYIQQQKPWETHDQKVLYELAHAIRDATILLSPFIPETAKKIARTFGFDITLLELNRPLKITPIKKSEILFTKIKEA